MDALIAMACKYKAKEGNDDEYSTVLRCCTIRLRLDSYGSEYIFYITEVHRYY